MEHDLAIAQHAYYVGELDAGLRSCERLLSTNLDNNTELMILRNRVFYMKTLDQYLDATYLPINIEPALPGWSLFNPSLLKRRNGELLLMVRSSNYEYNNGNYIMPDSDRQVIKTKSILCELNDDLSIRSRRVLEDPDYLKNGYPVDGLEDARLFETDQGLFVSATVRNVCPYDGNCRIGMARISDDLTRYENVKIITEQVNRPEKNWMPIIGEKNPKWLYACNFNDKIGSIEYVGHGLSVNVKPCEKSLAKHFRGGSQFVKIDDYYLSIIHEVAIFERNRVYSHRFVRLNEDLSMRDYSLPFYIKDQRQIEFAAGLLYHNNQIIVSFGSMDKKAFLISLPKDSLSSFI